MHKNTIRRKLGEAEESEGEGDPDDGLNVVVNPNADDSQRHTSAHYYLDCKLV